jgi:CRISPR-associated endonuclease/helicase Cas3
LKSIYIAHRGPFKEKVQSIKEHSENTARLCREYAISEWKDFMYILGLLHDVGKYQESFQRRIAGAKIQVEHAVCGAQAVYDRYPGAAGLMMAYCIAGHHGRLPDGGFLNDSPDMGTLWGKLKRKTEDYDLYKSELTIPEWNIHSWLEFLMKDCGDDMSLLLDKFAFFTRYSFSCLVDGDWEETAAFFGNKYSDTRKQVNFKQCLAAVKRKIDSFENVTQVQKMRVVLQKRIFQRSAESGQIFLLSMPVGSGNTLTGVRFALERLIAGKKKRIIYVSSCGSIIEQTAVILEEFFGKETEFFRHQSTFFAEDEENSSENWDRPFILTTMVQFFESVYACSRGMLRKLHNMQDSILIFDEVHLMPGKYLSLCLQAVSFITRYLNSEALFLTEVMPDFEAFFRKYALPDISLVKLTEEGENFPGLRKCRYEYIGEWSEDNLLQMSGRFSSVLIVVNRKKDARRLFVRCKGEKYHLSDYMAPVDRERVLMKIKQALRRQEEDFPIGKRVPEERKITVILTSLMEAGLDLDMHAVFREMTGLDGILLSGGKCNREGKRKEGFVFLFDSAEGKKISRDERVNMTRGLLNKYENPEDEKCVKEYYDRMYDIWDEEIRCSVISRRCEQIHAIPFQRYQEEFSFFENGRVSLVVAVDDESRKLMEKMKNKEKVKEGRLQPYACQISKNDLRWLIRREAADDFGTGIYWLKDNSYYDKQMGVLCGGKVKK